jgi:hypothetical protein
MTNVRDTDVIETVSSTTVPPREHHDDWLPLTAQVVERIADMDDPVLRNLWITQSYADLGERLLSALDTDQSWCSFATWASNTAGLSIREAELPHFVTALFHETSGHLDDIADGINDHPPIVRLLGLVRLGIVRRVRGSALGHFVEHVLAQVSEFIADGNVLVYRELAPVFVRLVEWVEAGHHRHPNIVVDEVLDELGVPSSEADALVHTAFRSYVRAAITDDEHHRAQHVLAANIAAVLHEQQRLQDDIRRALDADLIDIGGGLEWVCHWVIPRPMQRWLIDNAKRRVAPHITALWEHVATRMLMTLTVPGQTLHLGVDVPPLPDGTLFPPILADITEQELRELLDAWDPTGGTGRGSAARDWADLHSRMGYIVNLFRSRQQHLPLTSSPFTELELATMRDGLVPRTI